MIERTIRTRRPERCRCGKIEGPGTLRTGWYRVHYEGVMCTSDEHYPGKIQDGPVPTREALDKEPKPWLDDLYAGRVK